MGDCRCRYQKRYYRRRKKKGRKPELGVDEKTRVTDVAWTNDQWVYDVIWPFMVEANERGWMGI